MKHHCEIYGGDHMKKFKLFGNDVEVPTVEKYIDIVEDVEAKNEMRTARRKGRGKYYGYGAEGKTKAAMANAGMGALHATGNLIGSAFSSMGAAIKKNSLYNDPNTFNSLYGAFINDSSDVIYTIVEIMQKKNRKIIFITQKNADSARSQFNNISNPSFPKKQILDTMINVILLDPMKKNIIIS